jgi:putative AlgH/UPF0301 family transcriptional regulator
VILIASIYWLNTAMRDIDDLTGQLLIAIPNSAHTAYIRGVMLVTAHWPSGSAACVINRTIRNGYTVGNLMQSAGIDFPCNEPIFAGGPDEPNRIQFIHSMDWQCSGTKQLNKHIGITNEMSILASISGSQGPRFWRCICGHRLLGPGHIEGELSGQEPWIPEHRWLTAPADLSTTFNGLGDEQWINAINESSKLEIATWF